MTSHPWLRQRKSLWKNRPKSDLHSCLSRHDFELIECSFLLLLSDVRRVSRAFRELLSSCTHTYLPDGQWQDFPRNTFGSDTFPRKGKRKTLEYLRYCELKATKLKNKAETKRKRETKSELRWYEGRHILQRGKRSASVPVVLVPWVVIVVFFAISA